MEKDFRYRETGVLGSCGITQHVCHCEKWRILAQHEVSGPVASIEEARAARVDDVDRKTLGTLVGKLFNSFLVVDGKQGRRGESDDDPPFAFRIQVALSVDDFAQTEIDLRELVALRNDLVHHFLEQHDLSSLAGCDGALDALSAASARIEQANDGLRSWAKDMNQMRRRAAEIFVLPAVQDFILTGGIPWPITGIVRALREAEANLAIGGWTPVARAGRWISARYPEELPAAYRCRSWRQVIHESGIFELSYRQTDGPREAWYRGKG